MQIYIRDLAKEWLKATFRLFRHILSHKYGVKKDTEGIFKYNMIYIMCICNTDYEMNVIFMLEFVSRRQRLTSSRPKPPFYFTSNYVQKYKGISWLIFNYLNLAFNMCYPLKYTNWMRISLPRSSIFLSRMSNEAAEVHWGRYTLC